MSSIGDLDAKLAQVGPALTALETAVQDLISKIPPGDFTAEVAQVNSALDEVSKIASEVAGATPPPPPPPGG